MLYIIGRENYNGRPVYRVLNVDIYNGRMDLNNASVIVTDVANIFKLIQGKNARGEYNFLQNASIILKNTTRRIKYVLKYNEHNKSFYFEGKNADTGELVNKSMSSLLSNARALDMLDLEGGVYGSLSAYRSYNSADIVYTIIAEYYINNKHTGYCVVDQRCGGQLGYNAVGKAQIQIKQDVKFVSDTRILYRKFISNQRMSDVFTNAEVKEVAGGGIVVSPKKKYSENEDFVHVTGSSNGTQQSSYTGSATGGHSDVAEWRIVLCDGRTMRTNFVAGQDTLVFNKLKAMNVVELIIPKGVTDLSALNNMPMLKRVSIPSTVNGKVIVQGVGYNCKSLEYVLLGDEIAGVSPDAFLACPELKQYSVNSGNKQLKSSGGVLFSADGTTLIRCPVKFGNTTLTIPKGVRTIAEGAFRDCGIARVNIPAYVSLIGAGAFFGCTSLVEAWVAATNIMEDSFCNCPSLVTFKLLPGVQMIRGSLLSNNHCIDKLIFPDTLERVIPLEYRARQIDSPLKDARTMNHFLVGDNTSVSHICVPTGKAQLKYSSNYFDGVGRVQLHDNSIQTLVQAGVQNPQQYHVM